MWQAVGLTRDADALRDALARFSSWEVPGETVPERETRNLLHLARLVTHAALTREESRGAHSRSDFPETREEWAHSLAWRSSRVPEPLEVVR